jgi:hypothetical protein
MTRQHYRQHDLTSTLHRGQVTSAVPSQAWLGSIVASMTQHLHRTGAKSPQYHCRQHDSAALSPAWLIIYIAPQPSCLGSAIASTTQQHHRQHDLTSTSCHSQVGSTAPSPAWLSIYITSQPNQLGSAIASMTRRDVNADMLLAPIGTIHQYTWFQGQCVTPQNFKFWNVTKIH